MAGLRSVTVLHFRSFVRRKDLYVEQGSDMNGEVIVADLRAGVRRAVYGWMEDSGNMWGR